MPSQRGPGRILHIVFESGKHGEQIGLVSAIAPRDGPSDSGTLVDKVST